VRWADVVHLSAVYSFPTWPSLLACRLEEKPMVWSPRGALQDWRRHSKPLAKAFWRRVCKAVAPGRLALHVTSQRELEGSSVTRLGVPAFVIPNAVHPYPSGPMPPQEDSLRLLYLGRLHPTKGLEALFQACALVGKEHANRWCLSVAGEGQQGYVESLHALVARLEIGRNVVFVGDVRGPAKTELLLSNHVVVVPSHIESFGMVVAEALAHGRPVIASRGTPWSDVERMGCGLFVENTPEALANAILRFRGMPMAEMGERGRLWMRESFDWSKVAASMEALYRTVRGAP
jgi:glycosyltransferase involved in cell wall biosynthesis